MKKISIIISLILCILLSGCQTGNSTKTVEVNVTVTQDKKYNAAAVLISKEAFEENGFTLGDSVNIEFSNGYSLKDVPYFNGYYIKNGEPVVVAYPGFSYISITYNNMGIWDTAGLKEDDTVTIRLQEKGKYSAIQEVLGQLYSFDRNKYTSDEQFSNFRALSVGNLKENFLYRGASPVDNSRNRAPYTNAILEKTGIRFVIDLADNEDDMEEYIAETGFSSKYVQNLYENGGVVLLDMGSAYQQYTYRKAIADGLREMINYGESPVYIHCMEGKDRTGFVCMLIEALAGASYDEMLADYMITYRNYYGVSKEETPEKYEAIADLYFNAFVSFLHNCDDLQVLKSASYVDDARNYLLSGELSEEEIDAVISFITK